MFIRSLTCGPNCVCGSILQNLDTISLVATLPTDRRIRLIIIASKYGEPLPRALSRLRSIARLYSLHTRLPGLSRILPDFMAKRIAELSLKLTGLERLFSENSKE